MGFYIYEPLERKFLCADQVTWTDSFFDAGVANTRDEADEIAEKLLGLGHGAYVLDDGIETS